MMEALAQVKAFIFPAGAVLFLLYPVVVLTWTVIEGWASECLASPRSSSRNGSPRSGGGTPRRSASGRLRGIRKGSLKGGSAALLKCSGSGSGRLGQAEPSVESAAEWLRFFRARERRLRLQAALAKVVERGIEFFVGTLQVLRYAIVLCMLFVGFLTYGVALAPWFFAVGYAYCRDKNLIRGVRFGPKPRNYLDIYVPEGVDAAGAPVVVAVMGGAWVIGHRLWSAMLGQRLRDAGCVVVAVDYRNFPAVQVDDMVEDVSTALDWVFANVSRYGGDPGRVAIVGQSAGAHLSAEVLVRRCKAEAAAIAENGRGHAHRVGQWSVRDIAAFVGVSGVYDLTSLAAHCESRGLYPFLPHICAGGDLEAYSPTAQLAAHEWCGAIREVGAELMPPVRLLHGGGDCSVPASSSIGFAEALSNLGFRVDALEVRPGMRHTEPVIEDPMTGGDMQVEMILPCLLGEEESRRRLQALPPVWPRAPRALVDTVKPLMPF